MGVLHSMYAVTIVDLGSSYKIDLYRKLDRSKEHEQWGDVRHMEFLTTLRVQNKSEQPPIPLEKLMEEAIQEAKRF